MAWVEKAHKTSLGEFPIHGLFFLDGDLLARLLTLKDDDVETPILNPAWLKGQKSLMIELPSGEMSSLWESSPESEATIHRFGLH